MRHSLQAATCSLQRLKPHSLQPHASQSTTPCVAGELRGLPDATARGLRGGTPCALTRTQTRALTRTRTRTLTRSTVSSARAVAWPWPSPTVASSPRQSRSGCARWPLTLIRTLTQYPNPNPNPKLKPNPNSNPSPNPNQVVLNPPDKGTKLLWSAADELLVIQASGLLALSQVT